MTRQCPRYGHRIPPAALGSFSLIQPPTTQQPILDILAEMIAYDTSLRIGPSFAAPDMAELMRELGAQPGTGLD